MRTSFRHALLFSIAPVAITAAPVHAQQAEAAAEEDQSGIPTIIVSAQRRNQDIQDVPIAITAITGDALAESGVVDPRDLTQMVPSLSMQAGTAASTTSLFIRGVGIGDFNSNTTGAVGVYVDDVFIGSNAAKLFNVFDGDGIEVLKGPQGTLYGRNTTAGAIRFSSRKPTDYFTGNLSASYGRFNEFRLEGGVGGPLVQDTVAMRVSGLYHTRDGTVFNRVTGNKVNDLEMWAGRAIVDITPGPGSLIRLSVHGGKNTGGARQFQHRGQGVDFFGDPAFLPDGTPTDGLGYADTDGDIYAGDYNVEGKERISVFGASLTGEFEFDGVKLTSISAFEKVNRATLEDTDAMPYDVVTAYYEDRPRQFSQEVRLQSADDGPINWIVGGYYFHDKLTTDSSFDLLRVFRDPDDLLGTFDPVNSLGLLRYPYTQKTDSYAAFGQADVELGDGLTATLGLRYSHDRIDMDFHSLFDAVGGIDPVKNYSDVVLPLLDFNDRTSFDDLSWRAALNYDTGDTLVYASFSKGYNSGGYAGGASTELLQMEPFDSENLYAYEVGVKSDLFDRKLRLSASGFYYDYRDLQVFVFDLSGPIPIQRKLNAGNARIYGFEAEATVRPNEWVDFFGAFTLMDSKYKKFAALGGDDYSGNRLINAPKFAAAGGINVTVPLSGSGTLKGRLDGSYTSSIYLYPDNFAINKVGSHGQMNARIAWETADEKYEIAAYARNFLGEHYVTAIFPIVTMDQINYNDPSTYGVQVTAKF